MAKCDRRVVAVTAASSRVAAGTTTWLENGSVISATPRIVMDFPKVVPFVSTPLVLDTGFPFDPVREQPACLTGFTEAHYDGDGVHVVILHADECFPMARFSCIRYGWTLAKKLLCVVADFPELTVSTVLKNRDEFLGDSFRRIGLE